MSSRPWARFDISCFVRPVALRDPRAGCASRPLPLALHGGSLRPCIGPLRPDRMQHQDVLTEALLSDRLPQQRRRIFSQAMVPDRALLEERVLAEQADGLVPAPLGHPPFVVRHGQDQRYRPIRWWIS